MSPWLISPIHSGQAKPLVATIPERMTMNSALAPSFIRFFRRTTLDLGSGFRRLDPASQERISPTIMATEIDVHMWWSNPRTT